MAQCYQWSSSGSNSTGSYQIFLSGDQGIDNCPSVTNGYVFLSNSEYDQLILNANDSGQPYTVNAACYWFSNTISGGTYEVYYDGLYTLEQCSSTSDTSVVMLPGSYIELDSISNLSPVLTASDTATILLAGICVISAFLGFRTGNAYQ